MRSTKILTLNISPDIIIKDYNFLPLISLQLSSFTQGTLYYSS